MKQLAAALLALASWAAIAQAPAWPAKPVNIVANRPGASTTIAAAFVAKAEPDGCTLLATYRRRSASAFRSSAPSPWR